MADHEHTQPDGAGTGPAPEAAPAQEHDEVVPVAAHPEAHEEHPEGDPARLAAEEAEGDGKEPEPDFKDLYLRAVAETDNVRKRARRDVEVAQARGIARLAKELLPALDNLERALAAAEAQGEQEMTQGIRLVQQELVSSLERVGIVPDAPHGETFDPHRHEAVAQTPVEGAASGTIVEVYSAGYRFGDDVLRAAKVVVAQ